MKQSINTLRGPAIVSILVTALIAVHIATAKPVFAQGVTVNGRPPVGLILLDNLMSGRSRVGDRVHFETLANVYDDQNNLIIPAGSLAVGRVTRSRGSGMFGKRGELNFTCERVILSDGTRVPLVGRKIRDSGTNDSAATAAVTVLVSPLGLLIKGGTVKVEQGTVVTMYVADGDVVNPSTTPPTNIRADFTMKDKGSSDVIGAITGFDGENYTVHADGGDQTLNRDDIANISLEVPPVAYGDDNQ